MISFFSGLGQFLPLCLHAWFYRSALWDRDLWMLQFPLSEWGHVSRTGSWLYLRMPSRLYRIQLPGTIILPSSWLHLFCLRLIYIITYANQTLKLAFVIYEGWCRPLSPQPLPEWSQLFQCTGRLLLSLLRPLGRTTLWEHQVNLYVRVMSR